jgi:NADH-quinone oxidoreductase subunit C
MSNGLLDKAAVLGELGEHPAVRALTTAAADWKPEWLEDAKFERGELTLTVAADAIRAATFAVQAAGYNFFEDMTAVDWFPSVPRFQLSYHILSHQYKEHIRLRALVDESDAQVDSIIPVWPAANFYEREVFDLFGIRFNEHPNLIRIMMPEDFEGHPLRKDYPVEGYR